MKRKLFDTSFYIAKKPIPYTLVIIDVQEGYLAAENETLLDNILKEIKTARENDAAILFVNMDHIGRNIGCIWDAAYDYTYFAQVIKRDNDGSDAIIRAFSKHKFLNKTNLRVCGIYTHLCVTETVNGLTKKLPKSNVEVLTKCCNDDEDELEMDVRIFDKFKPLLEKDDKINPFGLIKARKNVQLIF